MATEQGELLQPLLERESGRQGCRVAARVTMAPTSAGPTPFPFVNDARSRFQKKMDVRFMWMSWFVNEMPVYVTGLTGTVHACREAGSKWKRPLRVDGRTSSVGSTVP